MSKVGCVASYNHQVVSECGRGDQAVFDRHGQSLLLQSSQKLCPRGGCLGVEIEKWQALHALLKPMLQSGTTPTGRQEQDSVFQLTEHDRTDHQLGFILSQPSHNGFVRTGLRRLAQYVGIDQKLHSDDLGLSKRVRQFRRQWFEPALLRAAQQPIDKSFARRRHLLLEQILSGF